MFNSYLNTLFAAGWQDRRGGQLQRRAPAAVEPHSIAWCSLGGPLKRATLR